MFGVIIFRRPGILPARDRQIAYLPYTIFVVIIFRRAGILSARDRQVAYLPYMML
jgi:hypothetical protein